MTGPVAAALIVGAGGVLGEALCREFAVDRPVIALRRPGSPAVAVPGVRTLHAVLHDEAEVRAVVRDAAVPIEVLVHNAAHLHIAPFGELTSADFERSWQASIGSAVAAAQAVLPGMAARRAGCLIFMGATASRRGGARFAAFAAAKFGLRGLAQSLARELQPQGIHVAHLLLDGLLQGSRSEARFAPERAPGDEASLGPAEVAVCCRQLSAQPRTAWTHEIDLRPWVERF